MTPTCGLALVVLAWGVVSVVVGLLLGLLFDEGREDDEDETTGPACEARPAARDMHHG